MKHSGRLFSEDSEVEVIVLSDTEGETSAKEEKDANEQDVLSQEEMYKIDESLQELTYTINLAHTLSNLHKHIWRNSNWDEADFLTMVINKAETKRIYRKAMVLLHPDKQFGASAKQKYLAEQIFKIVRSKWEEEQK
uniref:J domain-containing protein required for chloroplast accumulation response 1 n=1 Tax=Noccaea caerulescens TaxID=107243 RepID=A0A1J3CYE5_NOCCA